MDFTGFANFTDFPIGDFIQTTLFYIVAYTLYVVVVTTDEYITKENKRTFLIAIFLCAIHLAVDYIGTWASNDVSRVSIRTLSAIIGYSIRPFIIITFFKLSVPTQKNLIWYILGTINLLLYVTSPYTHWCNYISTDNRFQRGPFWQFIFILCSLQLIHLSCITIVKTYKKNSRRWILPPFSSIFIFCAVYKDYESVTYEYISELNKILPLVILLFYVFYHLQLVEQYHSELLEKQQLQLMVSQIKPHFFFNTITTIQALCHIDPKKASDTLGTFANYVRQNITTQTEHLIPFEQELKHVKAYVDIETLRFPNIDITYDLQTTDFDIAAFSIQPLIENAIKHGIRSKKHGSVTLHTAKTDKAIVITIEDNGVGFDVNTLNHLDHTHIGINNVRNRLQILQDGTMDISSSSDGTTITINIPH